MRNTRTKMTPPHHRHRRRTLTCKKKRRKTPVKSVVQEDHANVMVDSEEWSPAEIKSFLKQTQKHKKHKKRKPWETLSNTTKIRDVKRTFQQDLSNNLLDSKEWPPKRIQRARKSIPIYVKRYPTVDSPGSLMMMIVEDEDIQRSNMKSICDTSRRRRSQL